MILLSSDKSEKPETDAQITKCTQMKNEQGTRNQKPQTKTFHGGLRGGSITGDAELLHSGLQSCSL